MRHLKEKPGNWGGQIELGPSVSNVDVFDFLDFGGTFKRDEIATKLERLDKENPSQIREKREFDDEDDEFDSVVGELSQDPKEEFARQALAVQRSVDRKVSTLNRDQRKQLSYLLVRAKEGGFKFWGKRGSTISRLANFDSLIDLASSDANAERLHIAGEFFKKGVYYLEYGAPLAKGSSAATAEKTLRYYDEIKKLHGGQVPAAPFKKIEEFLINVGDEKVVQEYVQKTTSLKNALGASHLRLEKDLFGILTDHPEHAHYRQVLSSLDENEIGFVSTVLKKFIHPNSFREEVGLREFVSIVEFTRRNKDFFEEAATWNNDWFDLDKDLHGFFKAPSQELSKVPDQELFDRYGPMSQQHVKTLGKEIGRQFPEVLRLAEMFGLDAADTTLESGSIVGDILLKFSRTTGKNYFINDDDHGIFNAPKETFTRFNILGNFARDLLQNPERIDVIREHVAVRTLADLFFIHTLLSEDASFYAPRIQQLSQVLGEKIDVNNNLHYFWLHHKEARHWKRDTNDVTNMQTVMEIVGKDSVFPFAPQDMVAGHGRRNVQERPMHYGLAWYFAIKSDYRDDDGDEQRKYLHELENFYRRIDDWEGKHDLLRKAKEDGVFDPPFQKNLLCQHQVSIFYSLTDEQQKRLRDVIGFPQYDFSQTDFYVMANAVSGNLDEIFSLFKDGSKTDEAYFERIKSLLPEESRETMREAAESYFTKKMREPSRWDDGKQVHKFQIHGMTQQHLSLLEFVHGKESEELHAFLARYLNEINSDCEVIRPNGMYGLPPALLYALAHRAEPWVDKDLCDRMVGDRYYDVLNAKDFVFEHRIRTMSITEDNWLLAWHLMYDRSIHVFSHADELAGLMNTPEARNMIRTSIQELIVRKIFDPDSEYAQKVKEELQFLLYLDPKYRDKIIPEVDVLEARKYFDHPYSRQYDSEQEVKPWDVGGMRDDWLSQIEYLLEPEERQVMYDAINARLASQTLRELESDESGQIYVNDEMKFIAQSPFDTSWVDKDALRAADFAFNKYGAGERFSQYVRDAQPLEITEKNWAYLLNLFTYQNDKTLEGYRNLEKLITDPAMLEKVASFAKEQFSSYLGGNRTFDIQEKILMRFLTSYRVHEHAESFGMLAAYAEQIKFLEASKDGGEQKTIDALKACLNFNQRETYFIAAGLVLRTATLLRTLQFANTSHGLDDVFEHLFSSDTEGWFTKMSSDEPYSIQQLLKRVELLDQMNRYGSVIADLFAPPAELSDVLQFLKNVLGDSVENVKRLRFLDGMSPEYMTIVRETLQHSPKDFLKIVELLTVAKTVELPITEGFAHFVSNIQSFSAQRLIQIHSLVDKDAIEQKNRTRLQSIINRITRAEKRFESENTEENREKVRVLQQQLETGSQEKDHFTDLLERLDKAVKKGGDTRTEEGLKKEIKAYLTPILIRFFDERITQNVTSMITRDFDLDTLDFKSVDWGNFTSAYRMYRRLSKESPRDAMQAKLAIAKRLKGETITWRNFSGNRQWVGKNIAEGTEDEFMSSNAREYDVGSLSSSDIDGQMEHFAHEARRCFTALSELAQLNISVSETTQAHELLQIFKDLRGKTWDDSQRPVYEDLKIQVDALEQLMTLRNSRGTLPRKIVIERETDPIKITQMGTLVQGSCLHADSVNYWSAFTNAVEANKCLFWIKDEGGNILGRVLAAIDDNKKIVRFPVYYTGQASLNANLFFNQYIRDFGERYGFELNGSRDQVSNLVMSRWYKDPEVEID